MCVNKSIGLLNTILFVSDAICAAPAMGGWYRAQIIDVNEDNKTVDVRFLDYGGFLTLETPDLRKIRGDLMMLPFQAVECLLANVVPTGNALLSPCLTLYF